MNEEESGRNYIGTIITVLIATIVFATVLVPIVGNLQSSYYEMVEYSNVENDNQIYLSAISTDTSNTINVESTGITSNTGVIPYWDDATFYNMILITDKIAVWVNGAGSIQVVTSSGIVTASVFTAVASAGSITYSVDSADAVQITYTYGYIATIDGEYVSCFNNVHRYYDSLNFAQCRYDSGLYVYVDGYKTKNGSEIPMTIESSDVAGTEGQVKDLTAIKYTQSRSLNSISVMEAKAVYTYTEHPTIVTLLGVIPIFVVISILMIVIRRMSYHSDEYDDEEYYEE